jgi:cytochrome b6-f complex iron-sulfur subunit
MQNEQFSRGQFLKQMGMSSKALMAFYCMGALASCTKEDDPAPIVKEEDSTTSGGNTAGIDGTSTGANISFKLDLTHPNFTKLKTEGAFAYAGDVIVANVGTDAYIALSKKCTHEGFTIEYRKDTKDFRCPNHGSEFSSAGAVTKSPAGNPLTVFKTSLSVDKNILTIN